MRQQGSEISEPTDNTNNDSAAAAATESFFVNFDEFVLGVVVLDDIDASGIRADDNVITSGS
jgi:hypothetical protein